MKLISIEKKKLERSVLDKIAGATWAAAEYKCYYCGQRPYEYQYWIRYLQEERIIFTGGWTYIANRPVYCCSENCMRMWLFAKGWA